MTGGSRLVRRVEGRIGGASNDVAVQSPDYGQAFVAAVVPEVGGGPCLRASLGVLLTCGVQASAVGDRLALRGVQSRIRETLNAYARASSIPRPAARHIGENFVKATGVGAGVIDVDFDPGVVLSGNDVDDSANGVRAVDGGRAIEQNLDALDDGKRNRGDIRDATEDAAVANASSVHQDEGRLAAKPAQVHGRCTGSIHGAVELRSVSFVRRIDVLRQLAQDACEGEFSRGPDGRAVEHDQVAGKFRGRATQPAAGDLDILQLEGIAFCVIFFAGFLGECETWHQQKGRKQY